MRKSILSTKDIEDEFGFPVGTLRYWRSRNEGPPCFTVGRRRVAYRRDELEAWLDAQSRNNRRGDAA